MTFTWKVPAALSNERLMQMRQSFPRPAEPPPVAWFLSEIQKYHTEIAALGGNAVSLPALDAFLFDVASGIKNFGHLEAWDQWFQHLLPDLIVRSHEGLPGQPLLEAVITTFMNIYWDQIDEAYTGFSADVMTTLGLCLMSQPWWDSVDLAESVAMAPISASLFFCLKYLAPSEIPEWVACLNRLPGNHWKRYFDEWWQMFQKLYHRALQGGNAFSDREYLSSLGLAWHNSDLLINTTLLELVSEEKVKLFLFEMKKHRL
jgi:hypothetical protein